MNRALTLLLGAVSLVPLVYLIVYFAAPVDRDHPPVWFVLVSTLGGLICLGLILFYIVNIFQNPRVPKEAQMGWVLVLFLLGVFVFPIYWYIYLWKSPAPTAPPVTSGD